MLARPSQMMIRAGAVLLASLVPRPTDAGKLSNGAPPRCHRVRFAASALPSPALRLTHLRAPLSRLQC